jgi:Alpha/beta-hydrolase family
MITHANDAVGHFGLDLLVRAPDWLGPAGPRAATVPGAQHWRSPTTFVQTLVDMKNVANVIPGQFEARDHDYRADLARFVREVYGLKASDDQLATVEAACASPSWSASCSTPPRPQVGLASIPIQVIGLQELGDAFDHLGAQAVRGTSRRSARPTHSTALELMEVFGLCHFRSIREQNEDRVALVLLISYT